MKLMYFVQTSTTKMVRKLKEFKKDYANCGKTYIRNVNTRFYCTVTKLNMMAPKHELNIYILI